jgi:ATP-dependent DNA helicase Q4
VYCSKQFETDNLAQYLRTGSVDADWFVALPVSADPSLIPHSYHAGLLPSQRQTVQRKFMQNKLRVVVATIAFGMGLDKPFVRGCLSFSLN